MEDVSKAASMCPRNEKDGKPERWSSFDVSTLLDKEKFQGVETLNGNDILDAPGLYAIRIKNRRALPEEFANELVRRNTTLLYIGKAAMSIRRRLWEEELQARGSATFFRTIGAVLGFCPIQGSLAGKKNRCNYRFSSGDNTKIIRWNAKNLSVNFVACEDDIDCVEKDIIFRIKPMMNIRNNPEPFVLLEELRKKCRESARRQPPVLSEKAMCSSER